MKARGLTMMSAALVLSAGFSVCGAADMAALVDTRIGSSMGGNTCPGPLWPFGMVQPGPDTTAKAGGEYESCCNGYEALDPFLMGFTQTHLSGTGCVDLQDFLLLPFFGEDPKGDGQPQRRMEKPQEIAQPGYYAVPLEGGGLLAEVTASKRCAYYRFTHRRGGTLKVFVDTQAGGFAWWRPERPKHRVTFSESALGADGVFTAHNRVSCWNDGREVFTMMKFEPAPRAVRTLGANGKPGKRYVLEFALPAGGAVTVKAAVSGVDAEGAKRNFEADGEALDFAARKQACVDKWREVLGAVQAKGDDRTRRTFAAAVYRTMFHPNLISDVDGRVRYSDKQVSVRNPSDRVVRVKGDAYTNFSTWDTFRAAHPLYTILCPSRVDAFCQSMMAAYEATGRLPIWQMFGGENYCMPGVHSIPVLADALLKGITTVDPKAAALAMDASLRDRRAGCPLYDRQGYWDFETSESSVSYTLENGIDDYATARTAELAGETALATAYRQRAGFYRNLFDRSTGWMRARDRRGGWRTPFDPYKQRPTKEDRAKGIGNDYTEGGAMQYSWHVLQDPAGLAALHGGPEKFGAALEKLFTDNTKLSADRATGECSGRLGQFALGNEHDQHVPYLWQYAGRPDRVAEIVRELCTRYYSPQPAGICGNDDCGQMSAWYVFACLGFYPVNPVGGDYVLGAPQLDEISIRLENGKTFMVVAKGLSAENKYVKAVSLNGRPLKGFVLKHADIVAGGILTFEMGGR